MRNRKTICISHKWNCFEITLFCVGCDWDGGDCCGVKGYKFCKECKCKDCNYKPEGDACIGEIKGKCSKPSWKGDKNCDDENNNAGCAWDGGDCCGAPPSAKKYCDPKKKDKHGKVTGCLCLDPEYVPDKGDGCGQIGCKGKWCVGLNLSSTLLGVNYFFFVTTALLSGAAKYIGDGNCDDNNNNCGLYFLMTSLS